ncbi:MAG: two-component regulator propeller domain-containing protein [Paludibacteraceae bacterium]
MRYNLLHSVHHAVLSIVALFLCGTLSAEAYWKTLFAYNDVTQIAVADDKVFALSGGALFSVNKHSEQIEIYNSHNGLHGIKGTQIYYDDATGTLILAYEDGKIDLLHQNSVEYVSGLYDKDMMANKTINNITMHDGRAYLAMSFGIATFSLTRQELVDVYYIGKEASEVNVEDVLLIGDSIYAFASDKLYKACLGDNVVDYHFWQTEELGRINRDETKGKEFVEPDGTIWRAGGTEGIVRTSMGERNTYKPQGPLNNKPYSMTVANGKLYVVSGGRWATQYKDPGNLMIYDGVMWTNITSGTIRLQTGNEAKDFMNVAVDPLDAGHLFVTAYGGGVYEFRNNQVVQQYLPFNSTLLSRVESDPANYTRCSGGVFDSDGNFWVLNAGQPALHRRTQDGVWTGIDLLTENGDVLPVYTPGDLILDNHHDHYKWIPYGRVSVGLILLDDRGTIENTDDRVIHRSQWTDREGRLVQAEAIYKGAQDIEGNIWLGTSNGVIIIPYEVDYFASDLCEQIDITEENGENPFQTQEIRAIAFDDRGQAWIGTNSLGVYVVSLDRKSIVAHYTTGNTLMPGNGILSLAWDGVHKIMYIGTANGIVSCSQQSTSSDVGVGEAYDGADVDYGRMQQWTLHYSYSDIEELAQSAQEVYALADGALFSVNKLDETFTYWNKLTGLNGNIISHIAYDKLTQQLIICYMDGQIDLVQADGSIRNMQDLAQKASSMSVTINSICVHKDKAYLAMPFGIVAINLRKAEVTDTYYIGENAENVNILQIAMQGDSLYATCEDGVYVAALHDNLIDYSFWTKRALPKPQAAPKDLMTAHERLYLLQTDTLYCKEEQGEWQMLTDSVEWLSGDDNWFVIRRIGAKILLVDKNNTFSHLGNYGITDYLYDAENNCGWLAVPQRGIARRNSDGGLQFFDTNGPISNYGYRLKFIGGQLFVAGGSRWAVQSNREGSFSIYDGTTWRGITAYDTYRRIGTYPTDVVSFGVDPNGTDEGHFFAALYGRGVIEFHNYHATRHYTRYNSTLMSAVSVTDPNVDHYVRTEGAMVDNEGYLWVLNTSRNAHPINIMTPSGTWKGLDIYSAQGDKITLTTPWEIVVDNRDSRYKWLIDQRAATGVVLFYDGGTPLDNSDDRGMKQSLFIDQDNIQLRPEYIYCLAQDADGDVWLGTPTGIIIIPASVDFFTSNSCRRVKIPREDGTNLADYLLGTEQVNTIAVDGANRKWIGTETSGLYLMSADGLTTIAHFTAENSAIPSNTILSIAINPTTGEVFVGTSRGIASYRSDASEPQEDFSGAYAYPNPVRPNYQGVITITNLMDETEVNIVDAGGNLVCKTRSNGGTAIWDGKNFRGQRVSSGVYTALCNTKGRGNHVVVKILLMN